MSNPARSEEEITTILMALVAWAGQAKPAAEYLKSEKGITISAGSLYDWKTRYGERYDKLREDFRGQLELNLANEMREVAALATQGTREAVEATIEGLRAGREKDPARAAANLARVAQSQTDKLMTLTSRPVAITENRDATAILRKLVQMGVLIAPEEPKQIEEAQVQGESDGPGSS